MSTPPCPKCQSEFTYEDRAMLVCPECGHEWNANAAEEVHEVRCSNGNVLNDGDAVTVIRDLKVKGSSSVVKVGTKVKNIRVLDPEFIVDGHDIDCKIDGFGSMKLKSSVVKKN
ncbi:zinc ribbon domain-containing protein YjdM [Arenicella xantha]|uniref:Protein PhnA n=1 Tax=Arenicella xantha TaxID=644221 RepID=A0A395JP16_9GAMM|nr:zinc ribbon domain-containing protein YjdM [Arenicella xantha]RBP51314.1 protein PhnA [Arenicella xantha]